MKLWEKAYKDHQNGLKYKEIAEKYGVSLSAVKMWSSRYWKLEKVTKSSKGHKTKRSQKAGSLKHNDLLKIYSNTITDEEKILIETMPTDEETLLIEQIRLYSIRERRILKAIEELKSKNGGQVLSSVFRSEEKRSFKTKEDEELYNEIQAQKVADEKILPGETYHLNTSTESVGNRIERLEQELTRIQNAKTKAIATLSKINIEKEKLSLIREKDDIEVEDTEETDGAIYGIKLNV